VSSGSEPHLPAEVGSGATMYPTVPYGLRASSIKKSLAGLLVQLGMDVPNARAHIFKAPNIRAIMCLQDVQIGG
jgi:hypothetical protein